MPRRWSVHRAAAWGATFGLLYSYLKEFATVGWPANSDLLAYLIGAGIGGALGGAGLFRHVAVIRNRLVGAR